MYKNKRTFHMHILQSSLLGDSSETSALAYGLKKTAQLKFYNMFLINWLVPNVKKSGVVSRTPQVKINPLKMQITFQPKTQSEHG